MSDPAYDAISKAKRQTESGNADGAVKTLESYLFEDPHNVKVRLQLANVYVYGFDDLNSAHLQFEIMFDLEPENTDVLKAFVTAYMKNKKFNREVDEKYQILLQKCPDPELFNSYAVFLKMQMVDFPKSAEYYEKAISASPDKYEYHRNYAVLLLNDIRDYEKAKTELEEALRIRPNDPVCKKNLDMLMKRKFDKNGNLKKKGLSKLKR